MERAVAGEIDDLDAAILDAVDAWHEYQIPEDEIGENIMTWLGMSRSEYTSWVINPKELLAIIQQRKRQAIIYT